MTLRRVHVFIEGRVQGVYFRESTRQHAEMLGLSGYVRNLFDGRVEALFQGEEQAVQKALDFVAHGPPRAQVESVSVSDASSHEHGTVEEAFVILPTATPDSS